MNDNVFLNPAIVPAGRRCSGSAMPEPRTTLSSCSLPEDVPSIVDQLRSADRRGVPTFAQLPARSPGSNDTFAVDLTPGRYALVCFLPTPTASPMPPRAWPRSSGSSERQPRPDRIYMSYALIDHVTRGSR